MAIAIGVARQDESPVQCCDFIPPASGRNVLFVGAERPDEFADAMRAVRRGHRVLVVNPRDTAAARTFRSLRGRFAHARIEELPRLGSGFEVICENYPYPSGPHYVPVPAFARARLSRLAPGGRWIVFTESARLATALRTLVEFDPQVRRRFVVELTRVDLDQAPPSNYPPVPHRYRVIFERYR
jgi:hypothetical protein